MGCVAEIIGENGQIGFFIPRKSQLYFQEKIRSPHLKKSRDFKSPKNLDKKIGFFGIYLFCSKNPNFRDFEFFEFFGTNNPIKYIVGQYYSGTDNKTLIKSSVVKIYHENYFLFAAVEFRDNIMHFTQQYL